MLTTKTRKCKVCKTKFDEPRYFPQWCSDACGTELGLRKLAKIKRAQEAKERKTDSVKRESMKRRGDYVKEAQTAFNAWVKQRDKDLPCVSCGTTTAKVWHAGHFKSVGSAPTLRFEPTNVAKQCAQCNLFQSGNLLNYRMELVKRIGLDRVEFLEGPQGTMKWTIQELKEMKAEFNARLKALKNGDL